MIALCNPMGTWIVGSAASRLGRPFPLVMPRFPAAALLLALAFVGACGGPTSPTIPVVPTLPYLDGPATEQVDWRWSDASDAYPVLMRSRYPLEALVANAGDDLERVRLVSRWVHTRFAHDGDHASRYADPIGILEEAAPGARFRCVEYAAVTSGALISLGIPSRMVWLLTRDEATRTDGVAHVVAEAWLRDRQAWVMVDAQWDVVTTHDGAPLGALQLQRTLAAGGELPEVASGSGTGRDAYLAWIAPYLHYFYVRTDNRVGVDRSPNALLLAPVGDESLAAKYPAPATRITHSTASLYPAIP